MTCLTRMRTPWQWFCQVRNYSLPSSHSIFMYPHCSNPADSSSTKSCFLSWRYPWRLQPQIQPHYGIALLKATLIWDYIKTHTHRSLPPLMRNSKPCTLGDLFIIDVGDRRRECVSQLVYRMCEDNAVEELVTFNFAGFADEVEDALSFKARNVDPRIHPFYSKVLYSWYVFKGDYRNGKFSLSTSVYRYGLTDD